MGDNAAHLQSTILSGAAPSAGVMSDAYSPMRPVFLGRIEQYLAWSDSHSSVFKSRNNAVLQHVLSQIEPEWSRLSEGILPERMAVIVGSSNAGIEESENAVAYQTTHQKASPTFEYEQQEYGSPAQFLAHVLGVTGPAYTISTACSSSAKAFISAARLLEAGLCDIALVGGSDVLSQLTVNGFMSLGAIDGGRSQPFAEGRQGIHLGEAAALFILSRTPSNLRLAGWGESSDAHHMAAPHPEGVGAAASMRAALTHANLSPADIDYINLHGTGTAQNDAMEGLAVSCVFGARTPVSSTKSFTGHTLGAAGAIEALFCCLTLAQVDAPYRLPVHHVSDAIDSSLPALNFVSPIQSPVSALRYVLSNSFGFGGSNASLVFERCVHA